MKLEGIDTTVWLLTGLVLVFTALLIVVAKWMSDDSQTFQIVASLVTGFSGALLGRIKPPEHKPPDAKPVLPQPAPNEGANGS